MTKVYLVGDKDAPKTNQWLMMTNCPTEAAKYAYDIHNSTSKTIEVSENRPHKGGKRR